MLHVHSHFKTCDFLTLILQTGEMKFMAMFPTHRRYGYAVRGTVAKQGPQRTGRTESGPAGTLPSP